MRPFLSGEQGWWFGGLSTGVAFRPADADGALTVLEQAAGHFNSPGSSSVENAAARRDGDVVTIDSHYVDPDAPPPPNPDATIADEPGYDAFMAAAALPAEVSLLLYADPRPFRERVSDADDSSSANGSASDLLGRMLLWTAPSEGGYELSFYAEIVPEPTK